MTRPASLSVVALVCLLGCSVAHAQEPVDPSELITRMDRLQETIRSLTGQIEELQYHNQQLEQQLTRLQQEVEGDRQTSGQAQRPTAQYSPPPAPYPPAATPYEAPMQRVSPPYGSQSGSGYPSANAPYPQAGSAGMEGPVASAGPSPPMQTGGRRSDVFDPNANPGAPGAPRPLGTSTAANEPPPPVPDSSMGGSPSRQPGAPLDLSRIPQGAGGPNGQLPPPPPANPNSTGAMQATLPPSNSPRDEYDLGYGYLVHKDFGLAANTFNDFLHRYPSDRLTADAQYWLGESLFQNQNYHDAAEAFLTVSTKYETNARAPDALLRLGESLAALGEKEAACASLGEVLRKYPRASLSVKQGVEREQKRAHC